MKDFRLLYLDNQLQDRVNLQEKYSTYDLKEWLKFLYNFNKNHIVLDLGCGNGKELIYFSNYFYRGIGIDSSENLIQNAQQKRIELKLNNIEFLCSNCDSFLIQGVKFNIIFSNFAFYYFNEKKVLGNIYAMLKNDGVVFIGGSPDENAPELTYLISKILKGKDVPLTYRKGFSDVRKYSKLFKRYFRFIQFYRFVNEIRFPEITDFVKYLANTTLCQSLDSDKRKIFLQESQKIIKKQRIFIITKIVDVLRASNK